jgi:phospholipase/carboxylesterase
VRTLESHRVGEGDGPVVVLLHGFGAPGDDLVGLAESLAAPDGTRFVLPEAPIALGGGGRAWWPLDRDELRQARLSGQPRDLSDRTPDGLAEARGAVLRFLDETARTLELNTSQLVLGGFSQGAMLALDVALHAPEPPAAVVVMSGAPLTLEAWIPRMSRLEGVPVLVTHGRRDTLLSYDATEALVERLGAAGVDVRWAPFPGGHAIPPSVRRRLAALITEISSE